MLKDIVAVEPRDNYQIWLRFEDGVEGIVDVAALIPFRGVFAPLQDKSFFDRVRVNQDTGTICWANEADLDPDVLYAQVTGKPIPQYTDEAVAV